MKDLLIVIGLLGVLLVGIPYAMIGTGFLMGVDMGYWQATIILLVIIVISKVAVEVTEDLI